MDITTTKPLTKTQLLWQCRRGMLELDIILLAFCNTRYEGLTVEQKNLFVQLLTYPDQELYEWLLGRSLPENLDFLPIIKMMRERTWETSK